MREVCCPKCRKVFIPAPQHVFRDGRGFYCSWTCYNHRTPQTRKSRSHQVEQCNLRGEFVALFNSPKQAADAILGNEKKIRDACKTYTVYKGSIWRYCYDVP